MWESVLPLNKIREIKGRSSLIIGNGAIENTYDIIKELKKDYEFSRIIVVTGKSAYKKTGAWEHVEKALIKHRIQYVIFNEISPNPTTAEVDRAVVLAREIDANGVIGIGGGSAIDAAKSVAVMSIYGEYKTSELFESEFEPKLALPLLAINTTHGTGSEANKFAVLNITEKSYKIGIGYDFLYPKYSIIDPMLMVSLSKEQTAYTAIDALNHVLEASTSFLANPLVLLMSREVVRLVAEYLPIALEDGKNLKAKYCLAYASSIAGMSFDNSSLHLTHALEHPLSALRPEMPHGLGLAILMPEVIRAIYFKKAEILADVLEPIVPGLNDETDGSSKATDGIKRWLQALGINKTLGDFNINEENIDELVDLVYKTPGNAMMLYCSPIPVIKELIASIYRKSLTGIN